MSSGCIKHKSSPTPRDSFPVVVVSTKTVRVWVRIEPAGYTSYRQRYILQAVCENAQEGIVGASIKRE